MVKRVALFKDRLRQAIDNSGLTQAGVARKAGIRRQIISDYLKGKYEAKQENVYRLAQALNVSEAWLMGLSDENSNNNVGDGNQDEETLSNIINSFRSWKNIPVTDEQRAAVKASVSAMLDTLTGSKSNKNDKNKDDQSDKNDKDDH